ncbi:hypothetical protein UCRPA7_3197 [Phaeoacremonium minimum UCRPA7]|uniref:FluG domain-containing protein n=1 Tax=Phaeoacremonium minimum (strain UCR-PA7) TaxID=1286976 RepID=R8BPN5_PHAM7|nr:hypothetical protein UCRPA7_3197 [Phaeoacremonium minimum UCRPA7]EOO01307.1 hypothetical protein UCRPA7_3197 [Phaeoacremonium minimum UCRPA7]
MAPDTTSRDLHPDVLGALQRAAKRRHRMATVHKEQQPKKLYARCYQRMRKKLNKTKFICLLDADTTKCNIYYIKKRFIGRSKQKSINQYWRDFKPLYRRSNKGRVINGNDCKEVVKSYDRSVFPTEADRLDLPTIMLFQAYTACRPAELVDGTKSRGGGDPLKDEPDDGIGHRPSTGGPQDVSRAGSDDDFVHDAMHDVMQVDSCSNEDAEDEDENNEDEDRASTFDDDGYDSDMTYDTELDDEEVADDGSHGEAAGYSRTSHGPGSDELGDPTREHKALCYKNITLWMVKDPNQGGRDVLAMEVYFRYHKGTVFLFRKHPLTILCPISHILARAILDDAVEVGGYTTAEPFFSTRLGKPSSYLNHRVGFNVQDAFLERDPSADGLTWAFIHMSIRYNPEVPREIPRAELDKIDLDPDIVTLSRRVKQMFHSIRREYRFIKRAPQTIRDEYRQLQRDLRNAEKNFRDDMTRVYQDALRRRIHNEELERQLSGITAADETVSAVQHQLEERNQLQAILCDFNIDLDWKRLTDRKIRAINLMVALASRREMRGPRPSPPCGSSSAGRLSDLPPAMKYEEIPLVLSRTQCISCVGDETLSYKDRTRTFSRVSHMMDHVENVHLRRGPVGGRFVCHHPDCKLLGDFLENLDHFKHHVQTVHGVKLRQ